MKHGTFLTTASLALYARRFLTSDFQFLFSKQRNSQAKTLCRVLENLRQLWAPRTAWIIRISRNLLWALGGKLIEPIDHLGVTATLIDEASQTITAIAPALLATDPQDIELAD